MRSLMTMNIYDPEGAVVIVGACMERMEPACFAEATKGADAVFSLCLEETHINMAVTKIGAMLSTGRVTSLTFASVDRSPHCTQLHYIKHELERTMTLDIPVENYVAANGRLIQVSDAAIDLSKSLAKLADMA